MGEARRNKLAALNGSKINREKVHQFKTTTKPAIMMIDSQSIQVPQYKDIDEDYECFVDYMKMLDMDWEAIRDKGITAEVMIFLSTDPSKLKFQPCFTIPANQPMENGLPAIEFGIWAGVWTGIKGVLEMLEAQVKKPMRVLSASGRSNELRFTVMCE